MQRDIRSKDEDKTSEYSNIFQWGYDRQLYEAVDLLAEKVLKRNPANPDPRAQNAKDWAKQQLDAMKKTMSETSASGEFSMDDVQKIRFALLSRKAFGDNNPQIAFKNNAVTRFLKDMSESGQYQSKEEQQAFRKLSTLEQALVIKKLTGNKYQPDINIGKDPQLILDFKADIQPMLSRSCAQANCHGGDTPKLQLTAKASTLPQVYYNYYTIDTFRSTQETNPGNVIDHANPATDSLLINYLLPSNLAPKKLAHTPTIPAALKTKEDPRYAPLVKWLDAQPIYPIDQLMSDKGATMVEDEETSGSETTPETQPAKTR
jgi:plasmid maintenance system killer protein